MSMTWKTGRDRVFPFSRRQVSAFINYTDLCFRVFTLRHMCNAHPRRERSTAAVLSTRETRFPTLLLLKATSYVVRKNNLPLYLEKTVGIPAGRNSQKRCGCGSALLPAGASGVWEHWGLTEREHRPQCGASANRLREEANCNGSEHNSPVFA